MLKGYFAPGFEYLWSMFPNASLTSSSKLGDMDMVTMMYDGCLGQLQKNESDVMIPFVPFPVVGSGLRHSKTEMASNVVMVSGYNNTAVSTGTDVMDAFKSFSCQLWSLTILTAAILTVVVFVTFRSRILCLPEAATRQTKRQRTRRCMNQALIIVTANVLKQHTSYNSRGKLLCGKIILFLYAVFCFLIILYFSSMIKTEMVVQKRPETISSYEELLAKPNTKPLWTKQLNGHWGFIKADKKTAEGRIWERAKRMGIKSCFMETGADLHRNTRAMNRREAVWLAPSNMVNAMMTNTCAFWRAFGRYMDVNVWARSDENARERLSVVMQSAALHPDRAKMIDHIMQAEFEHHIQYASLKKLDFSIWPDTGSKSLRDCVAYKIIYPDYEIEAVHLEHYKRLFALSGWCLLLCLLRLSSELVQSTFRRNIVRHGR